jgi:3',5'-cyclic-AMP phosphodiesterase
MRFMVRYCGMAYLIAQVSDVHIGGPHAGNGERFSMAIDEINAMTRQPDLVLLTGDLTQDGEASQWNEFCDRLSVLTAPWEAIPGNHDRKISALSGHRAIDAGPLRLVLLDTSTDVFTNDDATWLEQELSKHPATPTVVAIHQPPFETGIWWMDCVGLKGGELMEAVVRRHGQVTKVLSGHIHRLIQANWGSCGLWVCPSTAVSIAVDLDVNHEPAETLEGPSFSLHAFVGDGFVSHLVPVGASAARKLIGDSDPKFVTWARGVQQSRATLFD